MMILPVVRRWILMIFNLLALWEKESLDWRVWGRGERGQGGSCGLCALARLFAPYVSTHLRLSAVYCWLTWVADSGNHLVSWGHVGRLVDIRPGAVLAPEVRW